LARSYGAALTPRRERTCPPPTIPIGAKQSRSIAEARDRLVAEARALRAAPIMKCLPRLLIA
jgi:hypothetical protein